MSLKIINSLHLAQQVGKENRIRYSGSPIPLSITERNYQHQVLKVEFEQGELALIESHLVPRSVDILRMPEKPVSLDETLKILKKWQIEPLEKHQQPLVEVPVLLSEPEPMLREKIQQVLEGKPIRLAKITPHYENKTQETAFNHKRLDEVSVEQVFLYGWQQKFSGNLPQPDGESCEKA